MNQFENPQILQQESILVENLVNSPAKLRALSGNIGLDNAITEKNIYRPQLALAGYVGLFNFERIQLFGNTENFYLKSLSEEHRIKAFETLTQFPIPCIVLTNGHTLEKKLLDIAIKANIAVFTTEQETTKTFALLSEFLDDQFSEQMVIHGSFVDVYGVGILFVGKSGIGKSEIALDLVERGHRLVADDVVMFTKKRDQVLMGTGTSLVQHFMEIRGLGIIDVRQMFGIRSIRFQKRLEIVVELEEWNSEATYDRTGLDEDALDVMGVEINKVKLPIFSGKNITVIAEVIALNYLLRTYGYDAAKIFSDKLRDRINRKSGPQKQRDQRIIQYLQGDVE
jgi:HPr kinase/phosphorylase